MELEIRKEVFEMKGLKKAITVISIIMVSVVSIGAYASAADVDIAQNVNLFVENNPML